MRKTEPKPKSSERSSAGRDASMSARSQPTLFPDLFSSPLSNNASTILYLQRMIGNHAVVKLLQPQQRIQRVTFNIKGLGSYCTEDDEVGKSDGGTGTFSHIDAIVKDLEDIDDAEIFQSLFEQLSGLGTKGQEILSTLKETRPDFKKFADKQQVTATDSRGLLPATATPAAATSSKTETKSTQELPSFEMCSALGKEAIEYARKVIPFAGNQVQDIANDPKAAERASRTKEIATAFKTFLKDNEVKLASDMQLHPKIRSEIAMITRGGLCGDYAALVYDYIRSKYPEIPVIIANAKDFGQHAWVELQCAEKKTCIVDAWPSVERFPVTPEQFFTTKDAVKTAERREEIKLQEQGLGRIMSLWEQFKAKAQTIVAAPAPNATAPLDVQRPLKPTLLQKPPDS